MAWSRLLAMLFGTGAMCGSSASAISPDECQMRLGAEIFFDANLSSDGTVSCSSCHEPKTAYADPRGVSVGTNGRRIPRNAPSLINVAFQKSLFWDGRSEALAEQALLPFGNPVEHGLLSGREVVRRLRANPRYADLANCTMPGNPENLSVEAVGEAVASFERQLTSFDSPFDRYIAGDATALNERALRGYSLFTGRGRCADCHIPSPPPGMFTDHQFHFTALGLPSPIADQLKPLSELLPAASENFSGAALEDLIASNSSVAALGRYVVTRNVEDIGRFKTPSLRNVAVTPPYMHDSSVETLEEAIRLELYASNDQQRAPIVMTIEEQTDLRIFLESLTDSAAQMGRQEWLKRVFR